MSLLYTAFQSAFKSADGENKWFPRLMKVGKTVDTQQLAQKIARESSLTTGDVHNAIRNLVEILKEELLNSHSVRLDGLGTFTVISRAGKQKKGVSSAGEVNHSQIYQLIVRFTPAYTYNHIDGTTRSMFTGVEFERMYKKNASQPVAPGDCSISGVSFNGTPVVQGSGSLSIASGDVLVLSGTGLTVSGIETEILTDPFGSPEVIALSGIGSVTADAPGTSLTVNVTVSGAVFSLLKAGDDTVLFNFE